MGEAEKRPNTSMFSVPGLHQLVLVKGITQFNMKKTVEYPFNFHNRLRRILFHVSPTDPSGEGVQDVRSPDRSPIPHFPSPDPPPPYS